MQWLGGTTELPILTVPGPGRARSSSRARIPGLPGNQTRLSPGTADRRVRLQGPDGSRTRPGQAIAHGLTVSWGAGLWRQP